MFPATQIISLGPRCATAHNLRRYFNFRSTFPFDWWITPEESIVKLLRNFDIDFVYSSAELLRANSDGTVIHKSLDIGLHHEFPRQRSLETPLIVEDFLSYIEIPKQRTLYLFQKMFKLNVSGERLLFVREKLSNSDIEDCLNVVFSVADWCLTSVEGPPGNDLHGWSGDPKIWDEVLASLAVELLPSRQCQVGGEYLSRDQQDFPTPEP